MRESVCVCVCVRYSCFLISSAGDEQVWSEDNMDDSERRPERDDDDDEDDDDDFCGHDPVFVCACVCVCVCVGVGRMGVESCNLLWKLRVIGFCSWFNFDFSQNINN